MDHSENPDQMLQNAASDQGVSTVSRSLAIFLQEYLNHIA